MRSFYFWPLLLQPLHFCLSFLLFTVRICLDSRCRISNRFKARTRSQDAESRTNLKVGVSRSTSSRGPVLFPTTYASLTNRLESTRYNTPPQMITQAPTDYCGSRSCIRENSESTAESKVYNKPASEFFYNFKESATIPILYRKS